MTLSIITVVMLSFTYAKCDILALYAECRFAECRYAECRYAEYSGAFT